MNLKVSVIQADLLWEDRKNNLSYFSERLSEIKESDLIILPEMFATGFSMNTDVVEDANSGESIEWLKEHAIKVNSAICGSLMVKEKNLFYNRLYFVEPNGAIYTYNKRHLFSLANEHKHYAAGNEQRIIQYKDWNIALQICYDLRFPVWSRRNGNYDYDLLIYVANWPERRSFAWKSLLKARAIENQSYVVGCNRIGLDVNQILHAGDSQIINPMGRTIASARPFIEETLNAELSKENLKQIRESLPFYDDSDAFSII